MATLEQFLAIALMTLEVVPTPDKEEPAEQKVRDAMDHPILRAAIQAKADVLLTGDKYFLKSEIGNPKIMTATQFIIM